MNRRPAAVGYVAHARHTLDGQQRCILSIKVPLQTGTRLGRYEIVGPLGAGGMGEVYRGHDERLRRAVAIKVLPADFARSAQARLRFEREARAISGLAHPNICTLYDFGAEGETDFLVMELIEGETLAQRISHGPLPLPFVIRRGIEIAAALEKAHAAGIVHRDLKPSNVLLARTGAKLLDFGLARAGEPGEPEMVDDATVAKNLTAAGDIIGTVRYMAPEQVQGMAVDGRTDIFALGVVLYEMLTGRTPFSGGSSAALAASILHDEPPALQSMRHDVPERLARVVTKCLAKEPESRWQNVHDLKTELEWIGEGEPDAGPRPADRRRWWIAAAVLGLALMTGAGIATFLQSRRTAPLPPVHAFEIPLPSRAAFYQFAGPVAISPDGRQLAFFAFTEGRYLLWLRGLHALEARPVPGTEGGMNPFWSPDSRSVAFVAGSRLKAVEVESGQLRTLAEVPQLVTGAWGVDDVILIGTFGSGIMKLTVSGGTPVPVTKLDAARQELAHLWPHFLPDGRRFLFFAQSADSDKSAIYLGSTSSPPAVRLVEAKSNGAFFDGLLLHGNGKDLVARPFDPERASVGSDTVIVAENVWHFGMTSSAIFSLSRGGTLAYGTPSKLDTEIVTYDRNGRELAKIGARGEHLHLDLSPNGRTLLTETLDPNNGNGVVASIDLGRQVTSRLTNDAYWSGRPIWAPDGSRMAYMSAPRGGMVLFERAGSGAGADQEVYVPPTLGFPTDYTPDGRSLILQEKNAASSYDLVLFPLDGSRKSKPIIASSADDVQGRVSPDGRWLAFASNRSGRVEVYVAPFPDADRQWQISPSGASQPRWSADGTKLFFVSADQKLMSSRIRSSPEGLEASEPGIEFQLRIRPYFDRYDYAVSADETRFFVNRQAADAAPGKIIVTTAWRPAARSVK